MKHVTACGQLLATTPRAAPRFRKTAAFRPPAPASPHLPPSGTGPEQPSRPTSTTRRTPGWGRYLISPHQHIRRPPGSNQPSSQHDTGKHLARHRIAAGRAVSAVFDRPGHKGSPRAHVVTGRSSKIARTLPPFRAPTGLRRWTSPPVAGRQPWRQPFSPALHAFLAKQNSRRLRPFAPLRPLRGASRRRADAFRPIEAGRRPEWQE